MSGKAISCESGLRLEKQDCRKIGNVVCHGGLEDRPVCLRVLMQKVRSTDDIVIEMRSDCIEIIIEASEQYHNRSKPKQQHECKHDRPEIPYADSHSPMTVKQLVVCSCMVEWCPSNADTCLPMQSVKPDIHDGIKQTQYGRNGTLRFVPDEAYAGRTQREDCLPPS